MICLPGAGTAPNEGVMSAAEHRTVDGCPAVGVAVPLVLGVPVGAVVEAGAASGVTTASVPELQPASAKEAATASVVQVRFTGVSLVIGGGVGVPCHREDRPARPTSCSSDAAVLSG